MNPKYKKLAAALQLLKPGDRVQYEDWRGGRGEGTFLRHIDDAGVPMDPKYWGCNEKHGLVVKRDHSADDGRRFLPFVGDGDVVVNEAVALMIVEEVMES